MHELLARMIGATPSHVLTLKDRLIDWLIDCGKLTALCEAEQLEDGD